MVQKTLLCLSCSFITVLITGMTFYLVTRSNLLSNAHKAMDTEEAAWRANDTVIVHWVDLLCPSDRNVISQEVIENNIKQSNAILMRSGASFKINLGTRVSLEKQFCVVEPHEIYKYNDIFRSVFELLDEKSGVVMVSVAMFTAGGFARPGDIGFIDKLNLHVPQKTLIHELGHIWTLEHPFDQNVPLEDLPLVCSNSQSRSLQLYDCPEKLRTCDGGMQDERLDNVMDYLPESCGIKYYFTPSQVKIIESERIKSIFDTN